MWDGNTVLSIKASPTINSWARTNVGWKLDASMSYGSTTASVEREPMWDGNREEVTDILRIHVEREPMWDGNSRYTATKNRMPPSWARTNVGWKLKIHSPLIMVIEGWARTNVGWKLITASCVTPSLSGWARTNVGWKLKKVYFHLFVEFVEREPMWDGNPIQPPLFRPTTVGWARTNVGWKLIFEPSGMALSKLSENQCGMETCFRAQDNH